MAYRFTVESSEAAANGDVHLDTWVEKYVGSEWVRTVPNGHFTVVLNGAVIMTIADGAGTDNKKRTALSELFRVEVASRGIDTADDAETKLDALITFPVSVAL
ncbi:hypothetical protein LCGC14_0387230 [marine sediment metagenome]|uniref:Uncharacterized protein n=1 Tax=marine sediment metagenome TaxID=412755 RepID=A0A0F9T0S9_9ZZZZ